MIFLLISLVFVYFLQVLIPGFTNFFDFDPTRPYEVWRFLTSIFLHANLNHLFFNALAIFMFAPILIRHIGRKEFYKIFLLGGIFANIVYFLSTIIFAPPIPALGASGAIYAMLGVIAILMPDLVIYFYFIPMRMRTAAILWLFIEFIGSFNFTSGVASAAHLGGLIFGLFYGYMLKKKIYYYEDLF